MSESLCSQGFYGRNAEDFFVFVFFIKKIKSVLK